MLGWSHMSHIQCMYHPRNTFTPRWGGRGQSRIVGDGLTCLTFGACTSQGTHLHQRPGWLRTVQDGWGVVSHVSHSVHVPPKEHIYTKVGQDS
jgi:hypothetical protein